MLHQSICMQNYIKIHKIVGGLCALQSDFGLWTPFLLRTILSVAVEPQLSLKMYSYITPSLLFGYQ